MKKKKGIVVAIGHFTSVEGGLVSFQADEGETPILAKGDTVTFIGDVNGETVQITPSLDFVGPVGMVLVKSGQTVQ